MPLKSRKFHQLLGTLLFLRRIQPLDEVTFRSELWLEKVTALEPNNFGGVLANVYQRHLIKVACEFAGILVLNSQYDNCRFYRAVPLFGSVMPMQQRQLQSFGPLQQAGLSGLVGRCVLRPGPWVMGGDNCCRVCSMLVQ